MNRRQIGCLIGIVMLIAWVSVTLAETVSEEAQRYMARGMAAAEMAKTPKDYERAVREFEQAAKLAPNWPDIYFNLGSVQAKAGNYGEAMRHYKRYLELAPKSPDAAKVREEIYKLEYRAEEEKPREKEIKRDGRFIAFSNGTVLDTRTDLLWAAKDNGSGINWQDAKKYCENYRGGGYSDWRMPTQEELGGLYDAGKSYKTDCRDSKYFVESFNVHLTELIHLTCGCAWSSETRGSDAAIFGFDVASRTWISQSADIFLRALPVRSAKLEDNNPLPGSASASSLFTGTYKGVRDYENGDKYEGEFTNRKPHGKGTFTFANGNKYEGDVADGKPHGKGTSTFANGNKYEGDVVDGKSHGKGTYTCGNGKQFTGNFENNKPIGFTIICN